MDDLLAHRQWVRSLARRLAADEASADDLEQDTWLAAAQHPPRDGRSVRGWLGTVVRNLHRNRVRGDVRREKREIAAPARAPEPGAPEIVAEAETQHALVREVLALEEPYRSTVLLRWYEDLTPTQIAERTGVPVDTVKTRLRRAVDRLRERMDDRFHGDRKAWCLLAMGHGNGTGAAGSAASGTTATLTGAAGGMAMGAATKTAIAAALLVAIGTWVWWTKTDVAAPPAAPVETAAATPKSVPRHEPRGTAADARDDAGSTAAAPSGADPAHPDRDLDLLGVVVRADGTPVAGAKVQAVDYPWRRTMTMNLAALFDGAPGAETTSNAAGEFALRLRRGEARILRVSADGLSTREMGPYQAGERVKIVMTAAVTLHVSVRDEAGNPVAGAALWLLGFGNKGDQPWVNAHATTDAAGKCDFAGLPGGAQVALLPQSGAGDWGMQRVPLPAAGDTSIDVVSPAGRTLRGRVFDSVTLAPVAGASVGLGKGAICATATDGGGRFEVRGFTGKNERNLGVAATGYAATALVVPDGDGAIEVGLQRGFVTVGRIVDSGGKPMAGVHVAVEASQSGAGFERASCGYATTAADGRFRIADLDRSLRHVVSAFDAGHGRLRGGVTSPRGDAETVDLGDVRLTAPRAIEGVVLKPDGSPSAGMDVTLSGPNMPLEGLPDVGMRETRRTDDLGRFRYCDLAPGDYTVEARIQSFPTMSTRVTLPADRDVADVVLPPKPATSDILVRVVDESGAPVAGMNVIARGNMQEAVMTKSDAKGLAVLAAPADGKIRQINVGAQDEALAYLRNPPITVEPGRHEYVVKMEKGAHVMCRLLDADGNPIQRASVTVEPGDRASYFSFPDAEGRMRLTIPRQGEFSIIFNGAVYVGDKGLPTDSLLEARADGVTAASGEVVLRCHRVETGRTATVRVLAADGSPVAGIDVRVTSGSGANGKATTDAEGRARFDDLPAHEFNASVPYKPSSLVAPVIKLVPAGQEVVLQYPAGVVITGTVVLPSGGPAPSASINVMRGQFGIFLTYADRDGRFTIQVPVGDAGPFKLDIGVIVEKVLYGGERAFTPQDRDIRVDLTKR